MGRPEQPPLEWGLHKEPMSPSTSMWHAGPEAGGEEDVVSVTPSIPTSHPAPALMSSDPASPPTSPLTCGNRNCSYLSLGRGLEPQLEVIKHPEQARDG